MTFEEKVEALRKSFDRALQASAFWPAILWLEKEFRKEGPIRLWVVGGTIRDFILETSNMIIDVDVMLEKCPSKEVLEKVITRGGTFRKNMMGGYKWYPAPAISGAKEELEMDMWRIEESIEPGDAATPELGVSRFDLSINALGWDVEKRRFINPLGGLQILLDETRSTPMELLTEKIKPGNAGRLILRAIKYAPKLGFPLGEKTRRWIRANEKELDTLPPDKIRYVFRAIDYQAIRREIESCCDAVLSPSYAAKVKDALFL
jgi:tRNA nucleotidyltransferase/poly(A) polymerase